jgi:hypothetical protein
MSPLYLYPVMAVLYRLSKDERYAWPASLGAGLLAGHLITSHGPSTLILGACLAGFLAGGRFGQKHERVSVALVFLMIIYSGCHPVALVPFLALALAAAADQIGMTAGRYILINAVLIFLAGGGIIDPWSAVAFLSGEVLYSYPYGGSPIGKKDRRYPGFRRRG